VGPILQERSGPAPARGGAGFLSQTQPA